MPAAAPTASAPSVRSAGVPVPVGVRRTRLVARLAATLPAAAVAAGGWVLAAHQPAVAAAETRYLAVVCGWALTGAALLAGGGRGPAVAATAATVATWALPAGPGRGVTLALVLVVAFLHAGWRRCHEAGSSDALAWAGAALALQALLRPADLLPAALAAPAMVRLLLPPLAAGLALALLAARRSFAAVATIGAAAALLAGGATATAALPLLALAAADELRARRGDVGGAARQAERRPWLRHAHADGAPGAASRLGAARVGWLWAAAAAAALPLLVLRPAAAGLAVATFAAASLRAPAALAAAAAPLALALALGRDAAAADGVWLLAALVPAALVPAGLLAARPRHGPPPQPAVPNAAAGRFTGALGSAAHLVAAALLAAGGALLLPGPPGLAAGGALLAAGLPAAAARRQLPWTALLVAAAALVAAYPWLRPDPLAAAFALPPLPWRWLAAAGAVALALVAALVARLPGPWRRWAAAALAVLLLAAAVDALPPRGRELLRGGAVELAAGGPAWRHPVNGSFHGVRLETLLVDGAGLAAGTPVATVALELRGRPLGGVTLRAGRETGEWAAGRPDLRGAVAAGDSPIAWVAPASGEHPGGWFARAYRARWVTAARLRADAVTVRPLPGLGDARLVLRRVEVLR